MARVLTTLAVCLFLYAGRAMAQEPPPTKDQQTVDQIKAQTDLIDAQPAKMKTEQVAENAKTQVEICLGLLAFSAHFSNDGTSSTWTERRAAEPAVRNYPACGC
jgi:hypothetical protein